MTRLSPEQVYRNHLLSEPPVMAEALNSVLPDDPSADNAATRLVRALCFEPAVYQDNEAPAFAEQLPHMLDHGVRQVALINAVTQDEALRADLPDWFDAQLLGQAALVADVGLSFVPKDEIWAVQQISPRLMRDYPGHPEYGFGMAESRLDPSDEKSLIIAAFIARHHALQAKRSYGLDWSEFPRLRQVPTSLVDLMVTLEKPFDYLDDAFSRRRDDNQDYVRQVQLPHERFTGSFSNVIATHLDAAAVMIRTDFDVTLPGRISEAICDHVTDPGPDGIGQVYRRLRPDLAQPNSQPLQIART